MDRICFVVILLLAAESVSALGQTEKPASSSDQTQRTAKELISVGCQVEIDPNGSPGLLVNVSNLDQSLAKTIDILQDFPNPIFLSLSQETVPPNLLTNDADFSKLCDLRIVHFSIAQVKLKPAQVQCIGRMQNLTFLSVVNCEGFNDEGLRFLNKLQSLELFGSDVTDAGLASVSTVQFLAFDGDRATGVGLSKLQDLYKLTLRGSAINNDGLDVVGSLPKLDTLSLTLGEHVNTSGLARLSRSPRLSNLHLNLSNETKVVGQELRVPNQFPQLRSLAITSSASSETVCELISGLSMAGSTNLKSLFLNCPNLGSEAFSHLQEYKIKPQVTISPCQVTEANVMDFTSNYQGRVVLFRGNDLTGYTNGKKDVPMPKKHNPYQKELRRLEAQIQELYKQGKSPSPGQKHELEMLRRGEISGK